MFVDCAKFTTEPCVTIELMNCDCDTYALDAFDYAFFSSHLDELGSVRLRFLEDDIPPSFLDCCTKIRVTLDWPEVGLTNRTIFSGRLTSSAGYFDADTKTIEWRGVSLNDKMRGRQIAYKSGTAGSTKSGITAIEAAYQYLVESLVAPLPDRGDGTDCSTAAGDCIEIVPPSAGQIADSRPWSGSRSYKDLWEVVSAIAEFDGFSIKTELVLNACPTNPSCPLCRISFVQGRDLTDIVLSECLENVQITRITQSCRQVERVFALGAGEGADRAVGVYCGSVSGCCSKEATIENTDESDPLALAIEAEEEFNRLNDNERILFDVVWGCSLLPWRDIDTGDIVTLQHNGSRPFVLDEIPFEIGCTDRGLELMNVGAIFEEITI